MYSRVQEPSMRAYSLEIKRFHDGIPISRIFKGLTTHNRPLEECFCLQVHNILRKQDIQGRVMKTSPRLHNTIANSILMCVHRQLYA